MSKDKRHLWAVETRNDDGDWAPDVSYSTREEARMWARLFRQFGGRGYRIRKYAPVPGQ